MNEAPPLIDIVDLAVRFRDREREVTALTLARLSLAPGQSIVVTGPSGCGKSTLLYALAGLLAPTQGKVRWQGDDIYARGEAARDAWRRRHIGFVFQDFELIAELSPLHNVMLPATFSQFGVTRSLRERAAMLLDSFDVPPRAGAVAHMSRGERQRVALARALLFDPPAILADEPTASLDRTAGAAVIDTLARLAAEPARNVIVASHDPALIERLPAQVALAQGRRA